MPAQMAALLQPLTELRRLEITCSNITAVDVSGNGGGACGDEASGYGSLAVGALLRALGRLHELGDMRVRLPVLLSEPAVCELNRLKQESLPSWVEPCCNVEMHMFCIAVGAFWPAVGAFWPAA